jgi:hypothetical protein
MIQLAAQKLALGHLGELVHEQAAHSAQVTAGRRLQQVRTGERQVVERLVRVGNERVITALLPAVLALVERIEALLPVDAVPPDAG